MPGYHIWLASRASSETTTISSRRPSAAAAMRPICAASSAVPTSATTRSTSSRSTPSVSGSSSDGISTVSCSVASSSEAVSAPANDSERSSTLTGRGLAVRAAATSRGSTPFSEGPAMTPISSPALRARADAGAEQRRAPGAGPEQALALRLDHVDQDAREARGELEQVARVELERLGDRARRHRRGALGAGDRVLRADHVALAHAQLDLAGAGGRPGPPVDQAGGDQPDAVARVAGGAQLLAGGELARAHPLAHRPRARSGAEPREQLALRQRRVPRHQVPLRIIGAAYARRPDLVKPPG